VKKEKLLSKLLSGSGDNNFQFADLIQILVWLGFIERHGKGSHRIFILKGIQDMINLQPTKDGKAKPFQVKQVREFIINHKLISYD